MKSKAELDLWNYLNEGFKRFPFSINVMEEVLFQLPTTYGRVHYQGQEIERRAYEWYHTDLHDFGAALVGVDPAAAKLLSREDALRKAELCVLIVQSTSSGLSEQEVQDQALKLMDRPLQELEDLRDGLV